MRFTKAALLALALLFSAMGLATAARRSLIPTAVHGRVTNIEVRREKHPGRDDVYLVAVEGRSRVVDRPVAEVVATGDQVDKDRWDARLQTSRGSRPLRYSDDVRGLLATLPVVLAAVLWLLCKPQSLTPSSRERSE